MDKVRAQIRLECLKLGNTENLKGHGAITEVAQRHFDWIMEEGQFAKADTAETEPAVSEPAKVDNSNVKPQNTAETEPAVSEPAKVDNSNVKPQNTGKGKGAPGDSSKANTKLFD